MSLVLLALGILATPVAYGWVATHAPTARHPSVRWLTRRRTATRRVVVCGASITHGRLSHDWVADLESRVGQEWAVLNTGHNGRRASDVRRWTRAATRWRPDVAIVMVGVNDALARSSIDAYRDDLRAIVAQLKPAHAVLLTLTVLGDDPDGDAARSEDPYNDAIREVAFETGSRCLDIALAQVAWLRANPRARPWPLRRKAALMASSITQRYVLGRSWDQISRTHGLALTTDLVHQNRVGGTIIADEVERFLRELDRTSSDRRVTAPMREGSLESPPGWSPRRGDWRRRAR